MILEMSAQVLGEIHTHGEKAYPEEGAGLLLGKADGQVKQVEAILALPNLREDGERYRRYLITPQDYLHGEQEASRKGLDVLGVFHSHPDHPNRPSDFDRQWAWPWFSYLITSVQAGRATGSRSWCLGDDRSAFEEEQIVIKTLNATTIDIHQGV